MVNLRKYGLGANGRRLVRVGASREVPPEGEVVEQCGHRTVEALAGGRRS